MYQYSTTTGMMNRGGIIISSYPSFYCNVRHSTRTRIVQAQNYETLKKSERRGTSFLKVKIDISFHLQLQSSEEQGWFLKKKYPSFYCT
jgi:hypothetical protein